MSGFAPAAAALLALLAKVDLDAVAIEEVRGGEAPVVAGQQSTAIFAEVLTPSLVLHLLDHGLEVQLDYAPRLFWQAASGVAPAAPLWLNVVNLAATAQTGPRLKLTGKASYSQGKTDYQYLSQMLFGPGQATTPQAVDVLSLTVGEVTELRVDPTWTLIVEADAAYRRPSGGTPETINGEKVTIPFPRQKGLQLTPIATDRLSNANDLVLSSGVNLQSTSSITVPLTGPITVAPGDFEVLTVSPEVGWRTRPSPWRELHLAAGIAYNHVIKTPYTVDFQPLAPIANADFSVNVMTGHEAAYRGTVSAAVDYYVNPVIATAGPRGLLGGAIYYAIPDWMVGLQGTFATPIGTRTLAEWEHENPGSTLQPDETVASLALPVRHRLSQSFIVEMGGRWSDRGPRLSSDFAFHQRQLWVYLTLTATSVPVRSSLTP